MFNTVLRPNQNRIGVSNAISRPAPVGGLNALESLANMSPDHAIILDNWFPKESEVEIRNGSSNHATGSGTYETIMSYDDGANKQLLVASSAGIYDVTVAGDPPITLSTANTDGQFQHVNFANSGGHFMPMVNGVDDYRYYNGSAIVVGGITGVTGSDLINVMAHKRRLFFVIKNTLKFAYLPVNSITGAASTFDLGPLCNYGGKLMAIGSWSIDAGDGMDDVIAFITSNGEVIVYQGTDPATASDWSLVGVYKIGSPIGYRCMMDFGGDLIVVTIDGDVSLAKALIASRTSNDPALSKNIQPLLKRDIAAYSGYFGWKGVLYPKGNMLLFNVPKSGGTAIQYVMNTTTKAWCTFSGWNMTDMTIHDDKLYFVDGATVVLADTGEDDDGTPVTADALSAFDYFGSSSTRKDFSMIRPAISSVQRITPAISVNVDFKIKAPTQTPAFSGSDGSPWDTSPWDTSPWGGDSSVTTDWISANTTGHSGAIRMKISRNAGKVSWIATDWIIERGGYL